MAVVTTTGASSWVFMCPPAAPVAPVAPAARRRRHRNTV